MINLIIKGKYNYADVKIDSIDEATREQIKSFCDNKLFSNTIKIMSDCHKGKGSVIGFTMPLTERVCPNVVGVDIGCSVTTVRVGKELPTTLDKIDNVIRQVIPMGFKTNNKVKKTNRITKYEKEFDFENFDEEVNQLCDKLVVSNYKIKSSIGSLGGGNHFIELGIDQNNEYWLTVHTGSRNLGKRVCDYWQDIAYEEEVEKRETLRSAIIEGTESKHIQSELDKFNEEFPVIDKELCFLSEEKSKEYLKDMKIAQDFARANHYSIIDKILNATGLEALEIVQSNHNYIDFKDKIIRKGAIRSYKGEKMVIPFNMRDGLLICDGKSNPDWNYSAPHGAGRVLSRKQAKDVVDIEDFKDSMKGIYSSSVCNETLDESPMAYKEASIIEDAIKETATILNKVRPVLNIKSKD